MVTTFVNAYQDYAEIARQALDAGKCALIVVDIQEKLLPADFSERATAAQLQTADSRRDRA